MDWFVILGPLAALAVVALLGFAGCGFEGKVGYAPLSFQVRVPVALSVEEVGFVWVDPAMMRDTKENPTPYTEQGFNVYYHAPPYDPPRPQSGDWTVTCGVKVTGEPVRKEATQTVIFPSDSTSWRVVFEASRDPDTGTFDVRFVEFVKL